MWSAGGFRHYDRNRSARARGVGKSSSTATVSTVQIFAREPHRQTQRGNTAASRCTTPHEPTEQLFNIWAHTWFLCRVPSSSSEELFMIPHRSFTILRRIYTSDPSACSRPQRINPLFLKSLPVIQPTPHKKKSNERKKRREAQLLYFCGSAISHTAQITHQNGT